MEKRTEEEVHDRVERGDPQVGEEAAADVEAREQPRGEEDRSGEHEQTDDQADHHGFLPVAVGRGGWRTRVPDCAPASSRRALRDGMSILLQR
jgi:hypothetical protein